MSLVPVAIFFAFCIILFVVFKAFNMEALAMGGFVALNQFYEFLGIEPKKELSEFGWWVDDELYWIDFSHTRAMVDDGLSGEVECWIIEMDWLPSNKEPD